MINFNPAIRRRVLAQAATPAPAPAPVVVQAPAAPSNAAPIVNLLGWSVLGFASGAATGYAVGRGILGHKTNAIADGLIGGIGGTVAALVSRLL